jgi:hypothetical protein
VPAVRRAPCARYSELGKNRYAPQKTNKENPAVMRSFVESARGANVGDFKDLRVWRLAHDLSIEMYRLTQNFPSAERFGLSSQVRRTATSISANIAESRGRRGLRDQ